MLRLGNVIGLAVGGLVGYLCSFDIDASLGSAKVPFYIGMGALFGWLAGFVFHNPRPGGRAAGDRDAGLTAAVARAEAEVRRLRARVEVLERGGEAPEAEPRRAPDRDDW
jgi:hypothetical protein